MVELFGRPAVKTRLPADSFFGAGTDLRPRGVRVTKLPEVGSRSYWTAKPPMAARLTGRPRRHRRGRWKRYLS